jgi:predicted phage tail protein
MDPTMNDIMLGLLGTGVAALIVAPGWRWALVSLCACGALRVAFGQRELATLAVDRSATVTLLVAIDIATLVCTALILLLTGLTHTRQTIDGTPDEVAQMELRRAARGAVYTAPPRGWDAYILPGLGLVLTFLGTLLLPRWYGVPANTTYAWTALTLGGVFAAATSATLLKLGVSLILLACGLGLGYLSQAAEVRLFDLVLLDLVPVVLALVTATLCSLMFGRMGTLRLAVLWRNTTADSPTERAIPRPECVADEARPTT